MDLVECSHGSVLACPSIMNIGTLVEQPRRDIANTRRKAAWGGLVGFGARVSPMGASEDAVIRRERPAETANGQAKRDGG